MTIRTIAITGSTNSDLLADIATGAAIEGDWLRALRQTDGRGRQGRGWTDSADNLAASTVIRLGVGDPPATTLAIVCGLALFEAVMAHAPARSPTLSLKWPNDLMRGPGKVAGILLERQGPHVVAGFGVNVATAPRVENRRTASLHGAGWTVGAASLLETLAARLRVALEDWRRDGAASMTARWLAAAHPVGQPLSIVGAAGPDGLVDRVDGTFAGLAADGALLLADAHGRVRAWTGGDVVADLDAAHAVLGARP